MGPLPIEHMFDGTPGVGVGRGEQASTRGSGGVERNAGMPAAFVWRGRRYEVRDVIGRWRIEGRWWEDGRDREYWRVEARGGAVVDLFEDRRAAARGTSSACGTDRFD